MFGVAFSTRPTAKVKSVFLFLLFTAFRLIIGHATKVWMLSVFLCVHMETKFG